MFVKPDSETIKKNFGLISQGYDRANDVMTAGLLRKWRQRLVKVSGIRRGGEVLDTATGTGDLAFLFEQKTGPMGRVVGLDFCLQMLDVAKEKAEKRDSAVEWVEGDVLSLPFSDHTFDVATISYGIRNVESPVEALKELARVVRPGGRVLVLETGAPDPGLWRTVYKGYFEKVLPVIGGAVSGHKGPYKFLQKSSMAFPSGVEFLSWMRDTESFKDMSFESFLGGVSYLYIGTK